MLFALSSEGRASAATVMLTTSGVILTCTPKRRHGIELTDLHFVGFPFVTELNSTACCANGQSLLDHTL
jgi:hypothetical protein